MPNTTKSQYECQLVNAKSNPVETYEIMKPTCHMDYFSSYVSGGFCCNDLYNFDRLITETLSDVHYY